MERFSVANAKQVEGDLSKVTFGTILKLALPALGVLAASPLYLLLDTAVVGRLGAVDLAALGAATTIQSQLTTNLTFLSYGTTARASRKFGAGDEKGAIAEGVQATWVALFVGIAICLFVWITAPWLALWLSNDPGVASEATIWLRVASLGIPMILMTMAGNGWLRGIQNTRTPFYFTLMGVIPSAISVPFLVDRMGIVGSAWSNLAGQTITSVFFVGYLLYSHKGSWKPQPSVMKEQLVLGRDLIARSLAFQIAFISAAAVAARFGTASLAAHQVLIQLWNFLGLVLDSLAIAAQTLVGAALGTKNISYARSVGEKVARYSGLFGVGLAAIIASGYSLIPRIFTPATEVHHEMHAVWLIFVVMILCAGLVFGLDGVLLGAADAGYLRNLNIAGVAVGFLPGLVLAYYLNGGLPAVWLGLGMFILIRMVGVIWRFRSMRWAK
ncbi:MULTISPECIES: MATE family efflux transporter [Corynebacterium]|uniref:MATE family efflux transporter n=1 Tax=Corynebacterium glucuronolyticum TaxID=39791 RepID=A0A7T4EHY9_9CORY|nr:MULTISPECIES: MATE family efflux transporter [Corynebacterium]MCT1441106.1 MATE family efflux transporter [Corynebacterium glucuronolyticum]MCT1562152.1 MATE family efflux transporter [Corynebacterium glucuronolyticum]OFO43746.1 MATE family efflux transporter [Corynebacterium sp. HMSC073D01]QQB47725.1 MATE family efflux transporter [Corynebacterium glucuronolyticum]